MVGVPEAAAFCPILTSPLKFESQIIPVGPVYGFYSQTPLNVCVHDKISI